MSVDAAATLTLAIETSKAKQDLAELKAEYLGLKDALSNGQTTANGLSGITSTLNQIKASIGATNASLQDVVDKSRTALSGLSSAYSQGFGGLSTSLKVAAADSKEKIEQIEGQLRKLAVATRELGSQQITWGFKIDRNFAGEVTAEARKAFEASVQYDKAWEEAHALHQARVRASEEKYGDEVVAAYARRNELIQQLDLERYEAAGREAARLKAIQEARDKQLYDEEVARVARRNELIQQLDLERYEAAGREAARLKAIQETRDKQLYDASVAAHERQLSMERRYILASEEARLKAAIEARKLMDAGYSGSLSSEFAPQTLVTAAGASNVAELEARLKALSAAHSSLAPSIRQSADHQLHWNSVAHEGQSAARGLAGVLGGLWVTYGSMVPLLAGAAIAGSFIHAAKAGAEFAYQLTFVKALGDESTVAVGKLSEAALTLSKHGLQGPGEIASGFRILAQAGLDAIESLQAMPNVLRLATVGEMSMEQAAITLTGVMNAFNLTVKDSEHIGDVFAKAAALSQTSVSEMTQALKTASVVGEQYRVSMEDTATAVTLLAKVNITGTAAGTAVRNMMKELYAPGKAAAEVMTTLGLKTKDASGDVRPFADIIYDLRGKLESFDKASQIKLEQALFGERGSKEVVQMLSMTRSEWDKLQSSIENSDGFLQKVSTQLEETVKGQWLEAVNTFKSGLIEAYQDMAPVFLKLVQSLKQMAADEDFTNSIKSLVSGVAQASQLLIEHTSVLVKVAEAYLILKASTLAYSLTISVISGVVKVTESFLALSAAVTATSTSIPLFTQSLAAVAAGTATTVTGLTGVAGAASMLATPLAGIAALLVAGVGLWLAYGDQASRTLEGLRLDADNSLKSIGRLNEAISDVRLGKVNGDLGVRGALDGYKELNKEVDAFEKKVREHFGNKNLEFDTEYRVKRRDVGNTYTYAGQPKELEEGRLALIEKRAKLDELARVSAENRAAGEEKLTSAMKTGKGVWDGPPKKGRDTTTPLEKSEIASLVERQKFETALLDSKHRNNLITEEQYQTSLAKIYEKWNPQILSEYDASLARLAAARDRASGQDREALQTKFNNMATARRKFMDDEELRVQQSADREAGIIKKSGEELVAIIKEQEAATAQIRERLAANRLKLDMTPEESASYEARKSVEKSMDKIVAKREAEVENLLNAGYTEESDRLRAVRRELELTIEARQRLGDEAAAQAAEEVSFARSYEAGWKQAFRTWTDEGANAAKTAADSFKVMTDSMENALDTFLTTGKLNFADFAKSVILSMAKIEAKALLISALKSAIGDWGGGFVGLLGSLAKWIGIGGSSGTFGGTIAGVMTNGVANPLGGVAAANGAVFSGSPSLHAYANTIQTSPRVFSFQKLHGFAKGGIFAEAGPEAVMPLTRDSRGRLGVRAANDGPPVNITIHVNGNQSAPDVRRSAGQGAREALSAWKYINQFS